MGMQSMLNFPTSEWTNISKGRIQPFENCHSGTFGSENEMQWIGSTAVETDFRCRQRKRQREPQMGTDGTRESHAGVIPACSTEPAQENPWEAEQQNAHYRVPRKRVTRSVIFTLGFG